MDFLTKKPKCAGCSKSISTSEPSVEAMKRKFHSKCFVCARCNDHITEDFHPVDDKPWCDRCYIKHKAPKCELCRQAIADKRIKTDDGKVYHEACIQKATQGNCDGCGKSIGLTESVTEALGKSFHQGCFCCGRCKGELPSQFHVDSETNVPLCNNCSQTKTTMSNDKSAQRRSDSPVLEGEHLSEIVEVRKTDDGSVRRGSATEFDSETIVRSASDNVPGELSNEGQNHMQQTQTYIRESAGDEDTSNGSQGKTQHSEEQYPVPEGGWFGQPVHRRTNLRMFDKDDDCTVCTKAITSGSKVEARGYRFHSDCFDDCYAGECSGCQKKIRLTEESVTVPKIQRDWHKGCLTCGLCHNQLSGPFQLYNDVPTCDTCYVNNLAPKCNGCEQPVGDSQLKAMQKIWHPDCFNCDVCHEPLYLSGQEYFNVEGKPYCLRDVQAANIRVI